MTDLDLRQIPRKCRECKIALPLGCSLRREFCGECVRQRRLLSFNAANHKRALTRTYSRMITSIGNSNFIFFTKDLKKW